MILVTVNKAMYFMNSNLLARAMKQLNASVYYFTTFSIQPDKLLVSLNEKFIPVKDSHSIPSPETLQSRGHESSL